MVQILNLESTVPVPRRCTTKVLLLANTVTVEFVGASVLKSAYEFRGTLGYQQIYIQNTTSENTA